MLINKELKQYLDKNIVSLYDKNDDGHNRDHFDYVLKRAINFGKQLNLNLDAIYTIVAFHDVGHYVDKNNHEVVSAKIFENDHFVKSFFNDEFNKIIKEAILDHRASNINDPRSIYGKVVSTADRNVDLDSILKRTYEYRKNDSNYNCEEIIEESYNHIIKKFGKNGYAVSKSYFKDLEYEKFLKEVLYITSDYDKFEKKYKKVNNLD